MRIGVGIISALLVVALAGCAPQSAAVAPPATPEASPRFASDEEALAAAEEAYAAYLAMSDQIAHEGGIGADRIAPLVTDDRLETELQTFEVLASRGWRTAGATTFETIGIQRADELGVVFYACWDGSGVRVLDTSGLDITPVERTERLAVEIVTAFTVNGLSLESDEPWSGDSSC
jgi:hypothetical protein